METTLTISPQSVRRPQGQSLAAFVTLTCVVGILAVVYWAMLTPVTLVIDDQARRLHTQQDTVATLLMDVGLTLQPPDKITPALDTALEPGLVVKVRRARPVRIVADGHDVTLRTHATSVGQVLEEARISLLPHDEVEVEGEFLPANPSTANPNPVCITVHRAVPYTLHDDGQATTFYTTAPTVGEALRRAGLTLYLADGVQPGLGERMSAGLHVYVDRSVPVVVQVDGQTLRARTHRERVSDVLADLGVVLTGQDYTTPTLDVPLGEDTTIRVVRVSEQFLTEQNPIPFDIAWQPDPDLEIDNERVLQEGARGVFERRIRVRYEDGHEIAREVDGEYVALPPTPKIFGYGTKIIVRTLDTPSGPVEYWRKIRMLATSYSASRAGTPKTSPWYGRTATGMTMRHGIVAVPPRVINLHSQVYVPGYGIGIAGDTGGAIHGRRIDLGYDDDNLVLWYRWVDVYLLTPVPDRINYVLD
ncbi:MAG: ubiquitin-like domain-containing protein [Chloroflexota bacterium]|nr:ubiquitin-like domain-containing protein [Chloroflexota bacterium]